jgi:hypothetical protein
MPACPALACRFYDDDTYSCPAQGIVVGDVSKKCDTNAFKGDNTLCSPGIDSPATTPCCTPCGGKGWFWQCRLPTTSSSYTFNILAGQFYYGGTCTVTVTAAKVTFGGCNMAPGWTASKVDVYLAQVKAEGNDCSPGQYGFTQELSPAKTGALGVSRVMDRSTASSPIYVQMHMAVARPSS